MNSSSSLVSWPDLHGFNFLYYKVNISLQQTLEKLCKKRVHGMIDFHLFLGQIFMALTLDLNNMFLEVLNPS